MTLNDRLRPPMPLTTRQREVLLLIIEGLTSKQVGRRIGVSHRTVEILVAQAKDRLNAKTRAQAAVIFDRQMREVS
jgi:DNA-binding CsgD family transcriptional regulator